MNGYIQFPPKLIKKYPLPSNARWYNETHVTWAQIWIEPLPKSSWYLVRVDEKGEILYSDTAYVCYAVAKQSDQEGWTAFHPVATIEEGMQFLYAQFLFNPEAT